MDLEGEVDRGTASLLFANVAAKAKGSVELWKSLLKPA
jgi:hypothetical protein